jgi:hypothetical protein
MARKLVCDANSLDGAFTTIVLSAAQMMLRLLQSNI